MNMVALSVDLSKFDTVSSADFSRCLLDERSHPLAYRATSIPCDEDDVRAYFIDDMPSTPVFVIDVSHVRYYRRMQKRFSYRAYPTVGQRGSLARSFGCARVVYNDFIAERNRLRASGEHKDVSFGDTAKKVTTIAKRTPERAWLSEVSSIVLQQSVRDADRAYQNWFNSLSGKRKKKVGAPGFKKRAARQSIRFRIGGFSVRETTHGVGFVRLAKIGDVRFALSRPLPSEPSSVTVIGNPDGTYEVSFVVDVAAKPLPVTNRTVGIDLGLTDFAAIVSSDGTREKIANPRHFRANERKLARAQKGLSRKKRGSANREKARLRVARIHAKIARSRADHAHKVARRIVDENQVIAVETLGVSALARTRLSKSIHDAGWGQFLRVLREKASDAGRTVVAVPRDFPSSQVCAMCGVRDGKKPLSVREWTCACGAVLDRDYNAAVNIMVEGLRLQVAGGHSETVNACAGGSLHRHDGESRRGADVDFGLPERSAMKQEPTEVIHWWLAGERSRNPRP